MVTKGGNMPAILTVCNKLYTESPVSVMTFGLLEFWRFFPGIQVRLDQIEKPSVHSVQLNKTNIMILLSRLFILETYNLSSGKIEL